MFLCLYKLRLLQELPRRYDRADSASVPVLIIFPPVLLDCAAASV
ncbi:hypothetical protein HMPREF1548_04312 [Clostridium sp. KLE 1755]|nr:hypothetical protein HMPREF1548_04312 [Clostridium sp. KLE 1755]